MALDPNKTLPQAPVERPLRVAFFGSPALALPTFSALLAAPDLCEIVAVVAQPDKPVGRGRRLRPPPVARKARELGLPLLQPRRLRSGAFPEAIEALELDLAVVIAYGRILTSRLLEAPRLGCVNVHASLLPAYRGAGPIQWAIIRGEQQSGVTTMWMEEGLDTGPILLRRATAIGEGEDAGALGSRLAEIGADLLIETLRELVAGCLSATAQPEQGISHAPLLNKEDGHLRWQHAARELAWLVRGVSPWPGAVCGWRGKKLKVLRARVEVGGGEGEPGVVIAISDTGLLVRCGEGALALTRVQPPGKRPMPVADFLRGYPIEVGENLSLPSEASP